MRVFVLCVPERNVRMQSMKSLRTELEVQQDQKRKQERQLRLKYDQVRPPSCHLKTLYSVF